MYYIGGDISTLELPSPNYSLVMKLRLLLCLLLPAISLMAQRDTTSRLAPSANPKPEPMKYELPDAVRFGEMIKAEDLKKLLYVLASDSMQGRETGEPGQRKAADFIAAQFKAIGLPAKADRNTYFQDIHMQNDSWKDIGFKAGAQEFKNRTDFYVFPANINDAPMTKLDEVVFVGYGIEDSTYSDYGKADVKGKAIIFYDDEPLDSKNHSLLTGNEFRSNWSIDWRMKLRLAKTKGATMAFIIDRRFEDNLKLNKKALSPYGWTPVSTPREKQSADGFINAVFVSQATATALFGTKGVKVDEAMADISAGKGFKPIKLKSKIELRLDKETKRLEGSNVIGIIPGSDSLLKKEYVLVTAHYDHLGMPDSSVIYNGADDNASGTSAVIAIARAFATAKKQGVGPKRTVVCMLVSGEEKGLLGSQFYTDFPIFPLSKTIVNINIDMIGRVDDRHANNPDYIYVIGSDRMSNELHYINERANSTYTKLELDYKYNAKDDPNHFYERSDHYNFAKKGVPAIFYFNGTHADYHKPTDTADKINFEAMTKRAKLAFYTAWDAANRPDKLPIDVKQ